MDMLNSSELMGKYSIKPQNVDFIIGCLSFIAFTRLC